MKLSNDIRHVAISSIVVKRDERQRRDLGDLDSLAGSIRKYGVLNPVIVARDLTLVAGERRLTACIGLGLSEIPVRYVEELNAIELKIIELEENIKRQDLTWQESVNSIAQIHNLFVELDEFWTQSQTAEEVNVGAPLISMYLAVFKCMDEERVQKAATFNEAYNILKRRDSRAMQDALAELLDTTPSNVVTIDGEKFVREEAKEEKDEAGHVVLTPIKLTPLPKDSPGQIVPSEKSILIEDFCKWVVKYQGTKFSFVHCDFPYGIEVFQGPQARGTEPSGGYGDGFNLYTSLLESFCKNLDRFMSISAHCIFWYSEKHRDVTRRIFSTLAPSLEVHTHPLIWVKSDNMGISSDPRQGPRHIYETALFITRGKRQILRVVSDAYSCQTDKLLHPSTKPEPMLSHFFEMTVDFNSTMFDPTCGSGASLRAAEGHGAKHVLGLEIDPSFAHSARLALQMSRQKNLAAKKIGGLV